VHLTDYTDNDVPTSTVILTGAVGDDGKAQSVNPDGTVNPEHNSELNLALAQGSFWLSSADLDKKFVSAMSTFPPDKVTCSGAVTVTGTSPVVAGSGTGSWQPSRTAPPSRSPPSGSMYGARSRPYLLAFRSGSTTYPSHGTIRGGTPGVKSCPAFQHTRPKTVIVTTVHQIQVVEDELPETEHDFSVDLIVTPDEVIRCGPPRRPSGIVLRHLSEEKVAEIPVLTNWPEV
jgi:5-formyltetrahydrofolate cyclo-ligase